MNRGFYGSFPKGFSFLGVVVSLLLIVQLLSMLAPDSAAQGITSPHQVAAKSSSSANASSSVVSGTYTYYAPFLANNADQQTTFLAIQNPNAATANISLQYFDSAGNSVTSSDTSCASLPSYAECIPVNPYGQGKGGAAIITSDQPVSVLLEDGVAGVGGSGYSLVAGSASSNLIVPIAANNNQLVTGFTVFNADTNSTPVTITFFTSGGTAVTTATKYTTLAAHNSITLNQDAADSGVPSGFQGWVSVTGNYGSLLAGEVLAQNPATSFVALVGAAVISQNTLYVPSVGNSGNPNTVLTVVNPNATSTNVSVAYYDTSGDSFTAASFALGPNAVANIDQSATSGNGLPVGGLPGNFTGSAVVNASDSGAVMIVNQSSNSQGCTVSGQLSSTFYAAGVMPTNTVGLPAISNGGAGITTNFVIDNVSGSSQNVSVQYYNPNGSAQGSTQTYTLAPNGVQLVSQSNSSLPTGFFGSVLLTGSGNIVALATQVSSSYFSYGSSAQSLRACATTTTTPTATTTTPAPTATTTTPTATTPAPGGGGGSNTYYVPFLSNQYNGYSTFLAFQNIGNGAANIAIQFFDSSGNPVLAGALPASCNPVPKYGECIAPNPYLANHYGSGIITSDQPLNVIVAEATTVGGSAYAVSAGAASQLYVPFALNGAYNFKTQITVLNAGNNSSSVTVQFYNVDGSPAPAASTKTLSIAAHTTAVLDQSDTNSGLPGSASGSPFNGWATVTGGSGDLLVAQVLEQRPDIKFVAIANAVASSQTTLYAPAIFNDAYGGYVTGANIINPGSTSVTATITYFDQSGSPFQTNPVTLAPHSLTAIYDAGNGGSGLPTNGLAKGFAGAAIITASGGVVAAVNEFGGVTGSGNSISGVYGAATNAGSTVGLPVMANGGFGYTTGATIFNTTNQSVTVTLHYYNVDGSSAGNTQTITLNPNSSKAIYQGDPSQGLSNFYGTAVLTTNNSANALIVTTNALSNLFYTYTEPN